MRVRTENVSFDITSLQAFLLQDVLNMERSIISSIERGLEDLKNMKIRVQNEPGRNYIRQDVSMLEYVDYGVATVAKI